MITPLYKRLKNKGTTLYVLPGAIEDKSAADQNNSVIKMAFSKFVLLNLPKKELNDGYKKIFDFNGSLNTNSTTNGVWNFSEELVGSLRNYVANQECVIRNSKAGAKNYLYNPNEVRTVTERIFWKWLKKLNVIEFEPASPYEYDTTSAKFNPTLLDNTYMPEILWRERKVEEFTPQTVSIANGKIVLKFYTSVNYKPGDTVLMWCTDPNKPLSAERCLVTDVYTSANNDGTDGSLNDTVELSSDEVVTWGGGVIPNPNTVKVKLKYDRCIQYIGEISASNSVQAPNTSYSETYAHIPAQSGAVPYVLFRTIADSNYKPNAKYPLIPSEIKQVIIGAESNNSPIVAKPTNYPGDYNAHYDSESNQYLTSTGDAQKKWGEFYGNTIGNSQNLDRTKLSYTEFDGSNIDGISIDFDIKDYKVAQSTDVPCSGFNEFTAATLNGIAPEDFEFNAVLWFYDFVDASNGEVVTSTNLYGIEFLDNPDREDNEGSHLKIPTIKKLVANGNQDGTAYTLSMNLQYMADSESAPMSFDPNRVYSLFGFDMFNEVMARLARVSEMYQSTLPQLTEVKQELARVKGLVYTQQNINTLKKQIENMESLLTLYSTMQIGPSDSVKPYLDTTVNPPMLRLESTDKSYGSIQTINAKDLFVEKQVLENNIEVTRRFPRTHSMSVGNGKDIMAYVVNNDDSTITFADAASKLEIILDNDLEPLQTVTFSVEPGVNSKNDNLLSIKINYNDGNSSYALPIVSDLAMPVALMSDNTNEPSSDVKENFTIKPLNAYITKIDEDRELVLDFDANLNFLKPSSRIRLNNFYYKLNGMTVHDLSGQYKLTAEQDAITFIPSPVIAAYVNDAGNNFTPNAVFDITVAPDGSVAMVDENTTITPNDAVVTISINELGSISSALLKTGGNGFLPSSDVINVSVSDGIGAIKLQVKAITRIKLDLTKRSEALDIVLSHYSDVLEDKPTGYMLSLYDINSNEDKLISIPYMDFNKGYVIKVTNTGKKTDIFASHISTGILDGREDVIKQAVEIMKERYKIQIEKV
jgi:hypothetical protein